GCLSLTSRARSSRRAHSVVGFRLLAMVATVVPHDPAPSTVTFTAERYHPGFGRRPTGGRVPRRPYPYAARRGGSGALRLAAEGPRKGSNMRIGDIAAAIGKGLVAGAAGTVVMTGSQMLAQGLLGEESSDAPVQAVEKVAGVEPKGEKEKERVNYA